MIVVIGNGKGGVGKTTTAVNLAVCHANAGHDVCLVDIDQRPQAATFIAHHPKELPRIHCLQKQGDVFDTLKDLETRYEQVIVDAGGFDAPELRSAILAAQRLVVPTRPSQLDIWALESMEDLIKKAKVYNRELAVFSLITAVNPNPKITEAEDAKEKILEFSTLHQLIPTFIHDRKIYRDAFICGKGAIEMPASKAQTQAAEETLAIFKEIYS